MEEGGSGSVLFWSVSKAGEGDIRLTAHADIYTNDEIWFHV